MVKVNCLPRLPEIRCNRVQCSIKCIRGSARYSQTYMKKSLENNRNISRFSCAQELPAGAKWSADVKHLADFKTFVFSPNNTENSEPFLSDCQEKYFQMR